MAGPAIVARQIIAWALRGTKHLSPVKTSKIANVRSRKYPWKKGTVIVMSKGKGQIRHTAAYRPWMEKTAIGEKSLLGKVGIGEEGRARFVRGYTKSYKHLKKHKKLYGAGGAGAAIWDFLPGKDNE